MMRHYNAVQEPPHKGMETAGGNMHLTQMQQRSAQHMQPQQAPIRSQLAQEPAPQQDHQELEHGQEGHPLLKRQRQYGPGEVGTTFLDLIKATQGELALRIMRCFPSGDYFKDKEFAACFALYSTCRTIRMCPAINENITTLRWWLDNSGDKNKKKHKKGGSSSQDDNNNNTEQQDSCDGDGEGATGEDGSGETEGGGEQKQSGSGSSGEGNSSGQNNAKHEPVLAPHQRWPKHAPPVKVMHIGTTYSTVIGVQEQRELQVGLCTMVRAGAAHPEHGVLGKLETLRLSVSGMMWDDLMAGVLWCNLCQSVKTIEMWSDERCLCTPAFIQHLALLPNLTSLDLDEQVVIQDINKCHGSMPPVVLQEQKGLGDHKPSHAANQEPSRDQHPVQQQQLQEMGPEEQQQLQQQQEEAGEEQEEAAKHDKYECGVPPSLIAHLYQLVELKVCMHARPGCLRELSGLTNLQTLTLQGVLSTDGEVHLDPLTSLTKLREVTISPWLESVHQVPWEGQQQVHVEALALLPGMTRLSFQGWVDSCWDMVLHGLDKVAHPFNKLQQFDVSGPVRLVDSCGPLWWPVLQEVEIDGEVPLATMARLTQHMPIHQVERLLGRSLIG